MADWIIQFVTALGYAGIAVLTLIENIFPPIPSELIIPLAGFQSSRDNLAFWGVVAAGSAGSLAGTFGWYWLGCRTGERRVRSWIQRHGRWLSIDAEDIDRASQWFNRHGFAAVFVCRMIPGLRTLISLPAGFHRMPMAMFVLASTAGTILWTAALAWAGYVLGSNYRKVGDYVGIVSWIVFIAVVLIYVWRQVRYVRRRASSAS